MEDVAQTKDGSFHLKRSGLKCQPFFPLLFFYYSFGRERGEGIVGLVERGRGTGRSGGTEIAVGMQYM